MDDADDFNPKRERSPVAWLAIAGLITVFMWQMPFGSMAMYPFSILSTWFHEMGHGLTAILMGGSFKYLEIFPNGSGLAVHATQGGLQQALVSAGGLLGPPIAGAFFIVSGSSEKRSRLVLAVLGLSLVISTVIWVRSSFGWVILPPTGLALLLAAGKGPGWLQPVLLQFLGVQACISSFHQLDYLFMNQINMGGQIMYSDTAKIASILFLPYWFWGGLIAVLSFALLAGSLMHVSRVARKKAKA